MKGSTMKWEIAAYHAEQIRSILQPHSIRCEIAGSIRRHAPECGDVEIVCIPKISAIQTLFGEEIATRSADWIAAAKQLGIIRKGCLRQGRYIQFLREGVQVDLFIASPKNFGLIFAIRTGPADYSHHVLAKGWVRKGYISMDGMLMRRGVYTTPVPDEQTLFDLIGLPFQEPNERR